jgi:hypothetical protein
MEKRKQETLSNLEQDLNELKTTLLELVKEHNSHSENRAIEPINHFGENMGGIRMYWVNWHDDNHSTHTIGFSMFDGKTLIPIGEEKSIPVEEAENLFLKEIEELPKK